MDRGAWQATVNGVTESDTTERPARSLFMAVLKYAIPKHVFFFLRITENHKKVLVFVSYLLILLPQN